MKMQKASSAQQSIGYVTFTNRIEKSQDIRNCLICMFFSLKKNPRTYYQQALQDESWVEAMQEELLQFITTRIGVGFLLICHMGKKLTATSPFESNKPLVKICYEKRLIEVIKIHTDSNVADLLTKGFDVTRFNFLVIDFSNGDVFHSVDLGSRESLEGDMDGTEEFLLSNLFDFWLTKVSTDRLKFWMTAKSRTINNISYIDATVAGKPVTISEASIRSDLLFDDADGIDSLNNQAIFDIIKLMGLARKTSLKKKGVQKGYVSKQGRKSVKSFKGEPSLHKDLAFDDLDDIVDDAMDYMESKDAQDEGRTSYVIPGT
ncbi:hypothetical protein Tco_0820571 [Tanacetum coccineum]|uniref:Uncharacterized protein n=1 Tax=Tanacetum coccineum TaxID=301880 RepID=A0ABQ5ACE6_9ASTR